MTASPPARRSRISASVNVLIALLLATVVGLSLTRYDQALALEIAAFARPIGRLWLNALQMTVVPLVTALVIVGVNTASNAAASGRTARNAIIVFLVLLVGSAAFSALVTPALLDLVPRDAETIRTFREALRSPATAATPPSAAQWISGLIPSNALAAAASA